MSGKIYGQNLQSLGTDDLSKGFGLFLVAHLAMHEQPAFGGVFTVEHGGDRIDRKKLSFHIHMFSDGILR